MVSTIRRSNASWPRRIRRSARFAIFTAPALLLKKRSGHGAQHTDCSSASSHAPLFMVRTTSRYLPTRYCCFDEGQLAKTTSPSCSSSAGTYWSGTEMGIPRSTSSRRPSSRASSPRKSSAAAPSAVWSSRPRSCITHQCTTRLSQGALELTHLPAHLIVSHELSGLLIPDSWMVRVGLDWISIVEPRMLTVEMR